MVAHATDTAVTLPALFHAADRSSSTAQRRHLRMTTAQLVLICGAALSSIFTWEIGGISYTALIGAAAIVFAGSFRVQLQITNPSKAWYQGRAAAESVKTLSWRYAVGGEPFATTMDEATTDTAFVGRLRDVLVDLDGLTLAVGDGEEITGWMRSTRLAPLDERKDIYATQRIADQRSWYCAKATWHTQRARRWGMTMLLFEAFAVLQALLKATGVIDVNVLGFIAAVIAAMVAWVNTKDFKALASAYCVAAEELSAISALIRHQETETRWSEFVADSEDSISREHTLWRASRT